MNPLLETVLKVGVLLDALGVLGLALLGLAALKLARSHRSWGGPTIAAGSVSLLLARLHLLLAPHWVEREVLHAMGPTGASLAIALPPLLLTIGLTGVVWGLWGHERGLRGKASGTSRP